MKKTTHMSADEYCVKCPFFGLHDKIESKYGIKHTLKDFFFINEHEITGQKYEKMCKCNAKDKRIAHVECVRYMVENVNNDDVWKYPCDKCDSIYIKKKPLLSFRQRKYMKLFMKLLIILIIPVYTFKVILDLHPERVSTRYNLISQCDEKYANGRCPQTNLTSINSEVDKMCWWYPTIMHMWISFVIYATCVVLYKIVFKMAIPMCKFTLKFFDLV